MTIRTARSLIVDSCLWPTGSVYSYAMSL